jgi:hypothetical protein
VEPSVTKQSDRNAKIARRALKAGLHPLLD